MGETVGLGIGLYIDLSKGFLNTSKLVKKPIQVHGANGKVFTRMMWVSPDEAPTVHKEAIKDDKYKPSRTHIGKQIDFSSIVTKPMNAYVGGKKVTINQIEDPEQLNTGHGFRIINSNYSMYIALKDGMGSHTQYEAALHAQGMDDFTLKNITEREWSHLPPIILPETPYSRSRDRQDHEERIHYDKTPDWYKVTEDENKYISGSNLEKKDKADRIKAAKLKYKDFVVNKDSEYTPEGLDVNILKKGTPITTKFAEDIKEYQKFIDEEGQEEGNYYDIKKEIGSLMKGATVQGLEHVFSFPGSDYNVKLVYAGYTEEAIFDQSCGLEFAIHHKNGEHAGEIKRTISKDPDGNLHVYNSSFMVDEAHRGAGIATSIYKRSEEYWKYLSDGKDVAISMTANCEVGKYAWARKGFDFAEDGSISDAHSNLTEFMKQHNLGEDDLKKCGFDNVKDIETAEQFATLDNGDKFEIKDIEGLKDEMVHMGKAFMLLGMESWGAMKTLKGGAK